MSRPEIRAVVLYEDEAHGKFARQLTRKLGLRPERLERCGGSGDVLDRFVLELRATRPRMSYQRRLALIVIVDADAGTTTARINDLNDRVRQSQSGGPRSAIERIVYVVPALEIENWYVHLCDPAARPIDESKDYKPEPSWKRLAKDIGSAAKAAVAAWDPAAAGGEPASLAAARLELARL